MQCYSCGKEIGDSKNFCRFCGVPVQQNPSQNNPMQGNSMQAGLKQSGENRQDYFKKAAALGGPEKPEIGQDAGNQQINLQNNSMRWSPIQAGLKQSGENRQDYFKKVAALGETEKTGVGQNVENHQNNSQSSLTFGGFQKTLTGKETGNKQNYSQNSPLIGNDQTSRTRQNTGDQQYSSVENKKNEEGRKEKIRRLWIAFGVLLAIVATLAVILLIRKHKDEIGAGGTDKKDNSTEQTAESAGHAANASENPFVGNWITYGKDDIWYTLDLTTQKKADVCSGWADCTTAYHGTWELIAFEDNCYTIRLDLTGGDAYAPDPNGLFLWEEHSAVTEIRVTAVEGDNLHILERNGSEIPIYPGTVYTVNNPPELPAEQTQTEHEDATVNKEYSIPEQNRTYGFNDDYVDFIIPPSGYILEGSNYRTISESELYGMTEHQLTLAKNEIYARHGRRFSSKNIADYFEHMPWYNGYIDATEFDRNVEQYLSDLEFENLIILEKYGMKMGWD